MSGGGVGSDAEVMGQVIVKDVGMIAVEVLRWVCEQLC